jgi:hypothetical protein
MSSAKRRKVDTDMPSGLSKGKKNVAKEKSPPLASPESSPEQAAIAADKSVTEGEEVVKSFKDLVINACEYS